MPAQQEHSKTTSMNSLYLGDNLAIMRSLPAESVDLIYLDPPFFSNRTYEQIWGDKGEIRSFEDRWSGGIDHYIAWLKERVEEMYRLLKPTGSLFLHCDWHANAYIRCFILDKIFGEKNFRSEIVWKRTTSHNDAKGLGNVHDTIFFYAKDAKNLQFNSLYVPYSQDYLQKEFKQDEQGKWYKTEDLTAPSHSGTSGQFEFRGRKPGRNRMWRLSEEEMNKLWEMGRIKVDSNGIPLLRGQIVYLEEKKGMPIHGWWDDILKVGNTAKERVGYPTQKPEKLLERIVAMASNKGDVVLDPFVGGGTTVVVAERMERGWIGIDQSVAAVKVTELRLNKDLNLFSQPFVVQLHKYDYDTLRYKDAFEFERWIVERYGGKPNTKQKGDLGLDGKMPDGTPLQVKRSDDIGRNVIDNFFSALQRADKAIFERNKAAKLPVGTIIAFSFGKGAVQEVARLKNEEGIEIKLVRVEAIVPIAKKPSITVHLRDMNAPHTDAADLAGSIFEGIKEVEFTAKGVSESGMEFYAWDFRYDGKTFKPEEMLDKIGVQVRKLKPGEHTIAVKAVDNDGLEALEIVRVKINGSVKRVAE